MCNVLLETASPPDPALVDLCAGYDFGPVNVDYLKGILNTQSREISLMRNWLHERGADEGTRCSEQVHMDTDDGMGLEALGK